MKKHLLKFLLTFILAISVGWVNGQIISQYIETSSGTTPKGIEIWNNTGSTIDFSVTNLSIWKGTNGATPSEDVTISTGTLADGGVIVIGTDEDVSGSGTGFKDFVEGNGATFYSYGFSFNGDDALEVYLDGVKTDVFGDPGTGDPGTGWSGNGVQTYNQNISILSGITTGDLDGWTDPSTRFETTTTDNSLTGFGIAPVVVADTDPPVATFDPADSETDVSITVNPTIGFDEAIYTSPAGVVVDNTNVEGLITFEEGVNPVGFSASISGNVITIVPDADLENNKTYTITLDIVEDEAANAMLSAPTASFTTIATKAEPENHVTAFAATANTYSNISLSWTDALAGAQAPDAYLIKASTGAITAPVDGTDPAEDTDLSDGEAIVKVLNDGTQAYVFDGLTAGTTYNFQIWPYTNDGTSIDFKTDGTVPEDNATTGSSELFFSEYIEGGGNRKALEIYNPTASSINLNNYRIAQGNNGGDWEYWHTFPVDIEIAAGGVYTIITTDVIEPYFNPALAEEALAFPSVVHHNGDDARALEVTIDGGTTWIIVDIIGKTDGDPGAGWDVAGTTEATANHTLIRKTGRTYGNTDWTSSAGATEGDSEWMVMPQDYFNNLDAYRAVNTDATLSDLTVDATTVAEFASGTYTYAVELPYGTTEVPTVAGTANDATYASVEVTQAQNLTGTEGERTATVTVTADDLSTQDYTVVFTVALNTENDITAFVFESFVTDVTGVLDAGAHTVTATVPYGTNVTALVPTITISADASIDPATGVAQDFTNPFDYTVTAQDGTEQVWTVTVNIEQNTENDITGFAFEGLTPTVNGTIDDVAHTVTATVPNGTDVTGLVPTITVSPDASIDPLSGVAQDFTAPFDYTVTAEDGTEQIWTVTITEAADDSKDITSFSFEALSVDGVINEADSTITLEVPYGTNVTALVATYATTGAEVKVGATTQTSGTTPNDFTNPVVYTVVAADASERIYTVTVNITPASTDATLNSLTVSEGTLVPAFVATTTEYTVELPYGTTTEPTVSADATDANANVDIVQATDLQGDLAARTATVTVTAEDNTTTEVYTVVFSVAPNNDATVSSTEYTVDNTAETITGIPFGTDLTTFEGNLTPADGATFVTYQSDETTEATDLATGYKVIVTAEDNTTTKTYTITIDPEPELFFSEYIEGGSSNKALEIYNPTSAEVDLSNYIIKGTGNEATDWEYDYPFPDGATIGAGEVYVIVDDGAVQGMQDVADWIDDGFTIGFNGNDARGLFKIVGEDTTLVDILGEYNNPTGAYYDAAGVTGALTDHTLIRKTGIINGNTDWASSAGTDADNSEWIVKDKDDFSDLGTHSVTLSSEAEILEFTFGQAIDLENAVINSDLATVDITVINGTDVTALAPTIKVSSKATIDPVSGFELDFSSPYMYTVTAEDETKKYWTVSVEVSATLSDKADITEIELTGVDSISINATDTSILVYAPYGYSIDAVKPEFTISAGASIADTAAARDFTNPQVYVVTAQDGTSIKNWEMSFVTTEPTTLTIYDIQYTEDASGDSPYLDEFVKTSGIVTGAGGNGFFIQTVAEAWNGIYVYAPDGFTVVVGDSIDIVGTVDEYSNGTQLGFIEDYTILKQGVTLPAPIEITDLTTTLTESHEGILVKLMNIECTAGPTSYNEWTFTDANSNEIMVDDILGYQHTFTIGNSYNITGIRQTNFGDKVTPRSADDILDRTTGINDLEGIISMKVYPNPNNGLFTVELNNPENKNLTVEVYDVIGRIVHKTNITDTRTNIDLTGISSGLYYVSVNNGTDQKVSRIVIK